MSPASAIDLQRDSGGRGIRVFGMEEIAFRFIVAIGKISEGERR